MKKLVFSTKRKSIYEFIDEAKKLEFIEQKHPLKNKGHEIIKKKYPNGLWVEEIFQKNRIIRNYSIKIDGRIIRTQHVEYILSNNSIEKLLSREIQNMFNNLEGSVWQ